MKRAILLISLFVGFSLATNAYVSIIADTYLDQSAPTVNYGTATTAYIVRDENYPYPYYDLLSKVNITSVPSNFTSFTCYYQQTAVNEDEILLGPNIPFDVYWVSCNWTETTVTYSSYPAVRTKFLDQYVDDNDNMVIVPATTVVQSAKIGGDHEFCFLVRSPFVIKPFIVYTKDVTSVQFRPYCEVTF
jgi:hypothetical protein